LIWGENKLKESLLYVDDITVMREEKEVLKDVSIKVLPGEITGILGRNGAGKSSLAYAVMGLPNYKPKKGAMYFRGQDITNWGITERARAGITLAWQHPARYEGISVAEYLKISSRKEIDVRKMEEALNLVQLESSYLSRKVDKSLSGGERKRIELASVYLMNSQLTILDEPDSGVDLLAMADIISLFRKMTENGRSVLIITHREDVASQCDRSYLMCSGEIVLEGTAEAVRRYFLSQCIPCPEHKDETGETQE